MREETKYIVIHCSQTRPSQKDVDAKWIDRIHRSNGWLKIGYARVLKRNGTWEQGREDDEIRGGQRGGDARREDGGARKRAIGTK